MLKPEPSTKDCEVGIGAAPPLQILLASTLGRGFTALGVRARGCRLALRVWGYKGSGILRPGVGFRNQLEASSATLPLV